MEKVHPIATPMFQIDDAASGEDTRKDVTKGQAELVASFLHEVEKYANGERQQRLLPLDDAGAPTTAQEDPENVLKFNTPTKGDDGEGKKAPKKKPVKKVAKKKSTARPKA